MRLSLTTDDGEVIDLWQIGPALGPAYSCDRDVFEHLASSEALADSTAACIKDALAALPEEDDRP